MPLSNATQAQAWVSGVAASDDGQTMAYTIRVAANSGRSFEQSFALPIGSTDEEKDAGVRGAVRAGLAALGETIPLADADILIWPARVPVVSGNSILGGSIVVAVPASVYEHVETIAAAGVSATQDILVRQDARSYTDDDENAPELLSITSLSAVAGTGEITVTMEFGEPTSGPIRLKWRAV